MSIRTKIQWCDSTVNPTMGCDGCELWGSVRRSCYAGVLHTRFGGATSGYAPSFEDVTLFPGRSATAAKWSDLAGIRRTDKPWLDGLPRRIFVSDMSDSLSTAVPFEYMLEEIVRPATEAPGRRHDWLWLTKRPRKMAKFASWLAERGIQWPDSLWVGTSVTGVRSTKRISDLLHVGTGTTTRFLSVEPQVEPLDLSPWFSELNWVIHGGESGRAARLFDVAWARQLIEQCAGLGVPYFLKQLGSNAVESGSGLRFADAHAGDWSEWPEDIRVRQAPPRVGSVDTKAHSAVD
jgi:protein gp37